MEPFIHAWTAPKLLQSPVDGFYRFLTIAVLIVVAVALLFAGAWIVDTFNAARRRFAQGRAAKQAKKQTPATAPTGAEEAANQ